MQSPDFTIHPPRRYLWKGLTSDTYVMAYCHPRWDDIMGVFVVPKGALHGKFPEAQGQTLFPGIEMPTDRCHLIKVDGDGTVMGYTYE